MLDARADDVGLRIHWEMHVRAGGESETVGLTAGAGHVFIYGPVRLSDHAVTHINALLDVPGRELVDGLAVKGEDLRA